MARFLFTYFQCIEGIVEGGKPMGGSLVQTLVWMRALHDLGHEVFLAKYEGEGREIKEQYKWIKTVDLYHPKKFKKRLVWFTYRFPRYFLVIRRLKCDYVYISMPHWSIFFIGEVCKALGVKQIIRIANDKNVDRSLAKDHSSIKYFFQDWGLNKSSLVIAQNQFQYNFLSTHFNTRKLGKLSNPIVVNQGLLQVKQHYTGYIAWLANFRHQKNLALLFDIALLLQNESFRIAGQPLIPMDEESATYYKKLQGLPNVEFVGVVSRANVFEFLKNAKFLLSTSRYEGFSNTFLESMVVGTPILTTPNVNPDRIITEFDLGVVYEDPKDLNSKLQSLDQQDYTKKSANCISYVQENHDHLTLGRKLLKLLGQL
jgi:glycosyltransferase involved in cell wall biosynthesis